MRRIRIGAASARRRRAHRERFGRFGLGHLAGTRRLCGAGFPDPLDELDAVILEDALRTPNRIALAVEQVLDAAQQIDVVGPVIAPAAAALQRLDLLEARFPESQDVLRQFEIVRNLTDCPECVRRLFHHRLPFTN